MFVGKSGPAEVDFAAQDFEGILSGVMDNNPPASYNGIKQKYALDWLLDNGAQ